MEKITFCKFCIIEINKSLLYGHVNSKEHKDIGSYFMMKCMTHCDYCDKEMKKDEWREHIISENHLELENEENFKVCVMKYSISIDSLDDRILYEKRSDLLNSGIDKKNQERLDFYI